MSESAQLFAVKCSHPDGGTFFLRQPGTGAIYLAGEKSTAKKYSRNVAGAVVVKVTAVVEERIK